MSKGLLFQGSYVWSHSISNEQSQGIGGSYTSLRDVGYDKSASPFDIRQAVKMNWVYELPFGPRHHFFGNVSEPRGAQSSRRLAARLGDARPVRVADPPHQRPRHLQPERIRRDPAQHDLEPVAGHDGRSARPTLAATASSPAIGVVYYLPQSLIDNTNAAFEVNGKTLANLDRNAPYIGPADQPGQLGQRISSTDPCSRSGTSACSRRPTSESAPTSNSACRR